jgi:HlyD family secretion protein
MSTSLQTVPIATPPDLLPVPPRTQAGRKRRRRLLVIAVVIAAVAGGATWFARGLYRTVAPTTATVPTTLVKRSDLTLTVAARGSLRGGNSEMLTAPLTGGGEMHVTFLRKTGELVKVGDPVIEFDPTDQEYKMKEAQADLAESKLKVTQAEAQSEADTEEARYLLQKAESDLRVAEFDVRKNPILPAITASQNNLALQATKDRVAQLRQDLANRGDTNAAAIAVQKAAVGKAEIQVATAQKNINALVVKAAHAGYVAIRPNQAGNFFFGGMTLPDYQIGDTVRGGMAVAEIPDLSNWEVGASFGELDRGHLSVGQPVAIDVIAVPEGKFSGKVADLGGTAGPPWNRHFECKIHLNNPSPELHPGMSVRVVVTTDVLPKVLWLPAQAVFESGSRTYVFVPSGAGFVSRDVKLVRRSESQVVIADLAEGQVVALSDPEAESKKKESGARGPSLPR